MKISIVPCGKIENENPHICFENENYPQHVDKMWKTLWETQNKIVENLWKMIHKDFP